MMSDSPVILAGESTIPTTAAAFAGGGQPLPDYGVELARMVGIIGIYLAALVLLVWLLPRLIRGRGRRTRRGSGSSRLLEQVDSIQLEPGKHVHVVRVGAAFYLIGSGSDGALRNLSHAPLDAAAIQQSIAEQTNTAAAEISPRAGGWRSFADVLANRPRLPIETPPSRSTP